MIYYKHMIPKDLRALFWDVRIEDFEPRAWPFYTIGRILEFGGDRAVEWMRANFTESEIRETLYQDRRLSRRSANFWALVYGVPPTEVRALQAEDSHHGG